MKKGFTLIELLGVIIILSLLMFLVFPNIVNFIKKGKDSISSTTEELIYNAAKLHVKENGSLYDRKNGNIYCITVSELIDEGNLPLSLELDSNIQNIKSSKSVKIVYNEEYTYEIVDKNSCIPNINS